MPKSRLNRSVSKVLPPALQVESLESRLVPTAMGCVEFCGYVYVDANNDGIKQESELGLPGQTVELYQSGVLVRTAVTDSIGCYKIMGADCVPAPEGVALTYRIVQKTQPTGYTDGKESLNKVVVPGSDQTDYIEFEATAGQLVCDANFGEVPVSPPPPPPPPPPAPAEVCGSVYLDADNDGVFDAGEQPISGVVLALLGYDTSGQPVSRSVTTAADGSYCFTNLPAGTYQVCETQPAGYADGKDTAGVVTGGTGTNSNGRVTQNDCIGEVVLTPGSKGTGYNFGERPLSPPPPPPGETIGREGLTPGYWKNNATKHNGSAWADTGYFMYQTVGSVFNLAGTQYASLANKTLVQALSLGGGGVNALLRSAVAAVLNAAHPQVDYPLTSADIISRVNAALASGSAAEIESLYRLLDGYNNLGAPLNQHGRPA